MNKFTHFNEKGMARMVDVSGKDATVREAEAYAEISMKSNTLKMILDKKIQKGDVFAVATVAGVMAAKKTPDLIPMCHPLNISSVEINFKPNEKENKIAIISKVKLIGVTGVEMEALTAVSVSALTIYDMCKAVDKEMTISEIKLLKKSGGKSGTFLRKI